MNNSTVPNLDDLDKFVYEEHAAGGTYIYHIERVSLQSYQRKQRIDSPTTELFAQGIDATDHEEFPPEQIEFLQTWASEQAGQAPDTDDTPSYDPNPSHSTCTASKAVGQRVGSAKKAKLITVKVDDFFAVELADAFETARLDIVSKGSYFSILIFQDASTILAYLLWEIGFSLRYLSTL